VILCQEDICLCKHCEDFRFPNTSRLSSKRARSQNASVVTDSTQLINNIIIIISDIYIAPYSARSCSKVLYNIIYSIIIIDSDPFPHTNILTPKEYTTQAAIIGAKRYSYIAIASCQVLFFVDE
jgi:hypothetical protein